MKKIKVLLVVLSSLFAIGYQFNFTSNPQCHPSLPTGKERPTTFVFIVDSSLPWKYLERILYLYKHISCGIPDSPELSLLVSHVWINGGNVSELVTSSRFPGVTLEDIQAEESDDPYCQRVERALKQIKNEYLRKNVQFITPIIDSNCSMIDVFNKHLMNNPEIHLNGILLNGNWSEQMKQEDHVVVQISNITLLNPEVKSMTSGENVNYIMEMADIVEQIGNFLHNVLFTSSSMNHEISKRHEINMTSIVVKTAYSNDHKHYGRNHHDNDTFTSFRHSENRGDVFRDYFWGFLVLIAVIVLIIIILMITFCFCCLCKKKSRKIASPMTATKSTESKSHDRATFATNEPMLIPKRTMPIIIRPRKVLLVHDQVDEWNKPKEGVSPAAGSLSATQVPTLNEIRISERQNSELNQEMAVYPRVYKPKRPSTHFMIE